MDLYLRGLLMPILAWGMPKHASFVAKDLDHVFYITLFVATFFFLVVIGSILFLVWRFRHSQRVISSSSHKLEISIMVSWFLGLTFFMAWLFIEGMLAWLPLGVSPSDSMEVYVTARRWEWRFSYPRYAVKKARELCVPEGKSVKLIMSSSDIMHNFFLPAFRIKRDIFPSRQTVLWFNANRKGIYDIFSAKAFDNGENLMFSKLKVLSEPDFSRWVMQHTILDGKGLYAKYGCHVCHSINGKKLIGPSLKGVYQKMRLVSLGLKGKKIKIKMDDHYIRTSILEPNKHIVDGFYPVMPPFKGRISKSEINLLIDYIKKLNKKKK